MSYDLAVLVPDIDPKVINPLPQKHTSFIVLMYIKIIIYSIGMVTERERETERSLIQWCTAQQAAMAGAGLSQELLLCLLRGSRGTGCTSPCIIFPGKVAGD